MNLLYIVLTERHIKYGYSNVSPVEFNKNYSQVNIYNFNLNLGLMRFVAAQIASENQPHEVLF